MVARSAVNSHALSGAYAVNALTDRERALVKRHLASCSPCTSEVRSLRDTAAQLAEIAARVPPAALCSVIFGKVRVQS